MQVDDYSQYTDEELEKLARAAEYILELESADREERRQQKARSMHSKRRGRSLGGAKVKR